MRFSYNDGAEVLHDVSFDVPAGGRVALLGPNGTGKSTVLSLIPRFYDVHAGRVTVAGTDVRNLDLDTLRRSIGIVFQENFLFSNTVAANIAFGHPDASREQVERAAKVAAADGFIRDLPKGYDTVIGENGVDLSGGQRQRLALARAVLTDPPILLLDDPTAAVDPQTEDQILDALDRAMANRTTLIVAHRVSTLSRADRVVVLERGRVTHQGTHDQLMHDSEHYRRVVRLQRTEHGRGHQDDVAYRGERKPPPDPGAETVSGAPATITHVRRADGDAEAHQRPPGHGPDRPADALHPPVRREAQRPGGPGRRAARCRSP